MASCFQPSVPSSSSYSYGAITFAMAYKLAKAGTIDGIWFYKTSGDSNSKIAKLYNSSGSELARKTFSGEAASGWIYQAFDSAVSVTANQVVKAAVHTAGYFNHQNWPGMADDIVNGDITALSTANAGAQGNASFIFSDAYPDTNYGELLLIDVEYTVGGGGSTVKQLTTAQSAKCLGKWVR